MKRSEHQDRLGMAILALVLVALAGSLAVQAALSERNRRIEREDRDPTLTGARSTLVLLDVTDSLSSAQVDAVRERLGELEEFELRRGELLSLCSIGRYADGDVRSWFQARFPGREVNPVIETPSRRGAWVDSIFSRPLREALDQALRPSTADQTGLAASIHEATELEGFGPEVPFRRLLLTTDLMENAPGFSLYRAPLNSALKAPPGWLREHLANLRGVDVEVLEIPRLSLSASERSALRAFWREYFTACGASSVRFKRLP